MVALKYKTTWKIFAKQSEKKNEVLNNLASKYNFPIKLKNKRAPYPLPPPRKNYLSEEQEQWLLEMLKRPDMTYTNPGRKDNVYIGKIDGERCYEQNRYLLWKLDNALEIWMVKKRVSRRSLVNHWLSQFFINSWKRKSNLFFNGTFLIHLAFTRSVRMQRWWQKQYGKKKKAIQQHHMISPKNNRAVLAIKTALVTDVDNAFRQKYFQDGMKFLFGKQYRRIVKQWWGIQRNYSSTMD